MQKANFDEGQKEMLEAYFIIGNKMITFSNRKKVTREEFKAFWKNEKGEWMMLTADDFCWFNPDFKDFLFADGNYIFREEMPKEVVELLDSNC